MVGLVCLEKYFGGIEVATANATDDLGEKVKSFFFGREVGEGKAGIGLDDADGGEMGEIEAFSNGLCTDNNIDFSGFYVIVESAKAGFLIIIGIEAGNFGVFKKFIQLKFKEFGAKTFMDNIGVTAGRTGVRDGDFVTTGMTDKSIVIIVEGERKVAMWTESLPGAMVANCQGGRTATVMKNQGLAVGFEIGF